MTDSAAPGKRYHDLDALRAAAMLLGIALHGMITFIDLPIAIWPAQDVNQSEAYLFLLHAIHGFRLPLFFLISGFFTAMLWRKRGLKALLKHRAKRILLPLVVFLPLIWLALIFVVLPMAEGKSVESENLWTAAKNGKVEDMAHHLEKGAQINGLDPKGGSTPLIIACLYDQIDAAKFLVDEEAELDDRNKDGSTALLVASFFGHTEIVTWLLNEGADPRIRNNRGEKPWDAVAGPWTNDMVTLYQYLEKLLQMELDLERIQRERPVIAKLLQDAEDSEAPPEAISGNKTDRKLDQGEEMGLQEKIANELNLNLDFSALPGWAQLVIFGAIIPVFHHLWFLYYLVWLIAGFAVVVILAKKFNWKPLPAKVIVSPWCWLWLIPLIMIPQLMMGVLGLYMGVPGFGPDTAGGLIPWPPKLLFYAIIFGYGAICFGHAEFEKVGRHWLLCFALAIPALVLGLHWYDLRNEAYAAGFDLRQSTVILYHFLSSLCQAVYVWLVMFGFIGMFRRFFSKENKLVRYLSDSSYWLYLAHLPLIMIIQIWVSDWPWPSFVKLIFICAMTVIPLLLIYEYVVRYTWVGTMLNGKRTREKNPGQVTPPEA